MAESLRDELIRLGIIKPAAPSSEPPTSPAAPSVKPAPARPPTPPPPVNAKPLDTSGWTQPHKRKRSRQRQAAPENSRSRQTRPFHQEMPGDPAWFAALSELSKKLCAMEEQDFRAYLSSKQAEELFNICEYIQRIMQGRTPPPCWLIHMAMDFADLGRAVQLTDHALWDAYLQADARHRAALAAWDAIRLHGHGDQGYAKLAARYPRGSEGRRWIDAAWNDPSLLTRRKAELRIAMAAYVAQRLRYKIGVKRAPAQPPSSVWEATGHSRRFGGGRPRSERFRR